MAPLLDLPPNVIAVVEYGPQRRRGKLLHEICNGTGGYEWHRERKG